jgi:NAD-dependent oxidoreductase involved in siderophore biosynthesis
LLQQNTQDKNGINKFHCRKGMGPMRKYGKTYDELMDTVSLKEGSQWSIKITDALRECIEAAPARPRNKLAQIYEEYMEKFGKGHKLGKVPPMLKDMLDAIEEGSDARVDRDSW